MKGLRSYLLLFGMLLTLVLCVPAFAAGTGDTGQDNGQNNTENNNQNENNQNGNDQNSNDQNDNKPVVTVKQGLLKENGKYYFYSNGRKVKSTWKKISGKQYYFNSNGYAVTYSAKINGKLYVFKTNGQLAQPAKASIVNVGKYSYYVNKSGIASTGWLVINKKLYYADSKGRFLKNKTYQGVTFSSTGAAKSSTAAKLKMKTMDVVSSITTSKMSKSQKLKACWNYITSSGRFRYWPHTPNTSKKGWQKDEAYSMLTSFKGSCSGFACAFAALASEVGYDSYVIRGRVSGSRDGAADGLTRHCWVKIDGRYYDPEAQFAGWMRGVYGSSSYNIRHTIQMTVNFANSN